MKIDNSFYSIPTLKLYKQFKIEVETINYYVLKNNSNNEFQSFKQKLYNYINQIDKIPLCPECKINHLAFKSSRDGYRMYCCVKCRANSDTNKKKIENTIKQKYGESYINISQIPSIKKQKENKFIENYGTSCSFDTQEIIEKIKSTWKNNYDAENPSYCEIIKRKISLANILNGKERFKKISKTLIEKYGVNNMSQLKNHQRESKYEIKLREKLGGIKRTIKYKEFDIVLENEKVIIEVDGIFYHPSKLSNLKRIQIINVVNDLEKEKRICDLNYKFYRVNTEIIEKAFKEGIKVDLEFVILNSYIPDRNFEQIKDVVSKEEVMKVYENKTKKEFDRFIVAIRSLLKIIKNIITDSNEIFLKEYYNIKY